MRPLRPRLLVPTLLLAASLAGCETEAVPPPQYPPQPQPQVQPPQEQPPPSYSDFEETDPSALQDFYPALSPYGTWQADPQYGTVWQPDPYAVGADFNQMLHIDQ